MVGNYKSKKKHVVDKNCDRYKNGGNCSFRVHVWNPHGSHSCLETALLAMFSFMSPRIPFETECYSQEVVITSPIKN